MWLNLYMANIICKSWNREKVLLTLFSKAITGLWTTNWATTNQMIIPFNELPYFKSRYSLKSHKLSEHGEGKGFQCTICPAKFTISGNLKNHIAAVHEGLKPFNCTLCDYKCNKRDSLKKHMNTHVKDRVKPFECPREGCDTRFFTAFAQKVIY